MNVQRTDSKENFLHQKNASVPYFFGSFVKKVSPIVFWFDSYCRQKVQEHILRYQHSRNGLILLGPRDHGIKALGELESNVELQFILSYLSGGM